LELKCGDVKGRRARPVIICLGNTHAAGWVTLPIRCYPNRDRHLFQCDISRRTLIQVKEVVGCIVGYHDIRLAVILGIHGHDRQPFAVLRLLSFFRILHRLAILIDFVRFALQVIGVNLTIAAQTTAITNVGKSAITIVAVERMRQRQEVPGIAQIAPIIGRIKARPILGFQIPIEIVNHVDVGIAFAVKVCEACTGTPEIVVELRLFGHFNELSAPCLLILHIVEQGHPAIAGHQQVRPAVLVVIPDRGTVRVKIDLVQTDLGGDILELEVAQVLVELAGVALHLVLIRSAEVAAAAHEDIEQPVTVIVKEGHTAADGLQQGVMACFLAVAVCEVHPCFFGHVFEIVTKFRFWGRRRGMSARGTERDQSDNPGGRQQDAPQRKERRSSRYSDWRTRHGSRPRKEQSRRRLKPATTRMPSP